MSLRGLGRLAASVSVAAAVACIDITVSGSELGSLQFVPLPYPSVDEGDTLRDASDKVAPLVAVAYRSNGTPDPEIPIEFVALDTGLTIVSTTHLVKGNALPATTSSRSVRVIASAAGLQTTARTLFVVPRADTLIPNSKLADTIDYSIPTTSSDVTGPLSVKVGKRATSSVLGSQGYLVRYVLMRGLTVLPANDTTLSYVFQDDQGRVSTIDTTDATGVAHRVLRFRIRPSQPTIDNLTVLAEAVRGSRMKSDTIKWTVRVAPK